MMAASLVIADFTPTTGSHLITKIDHLIRTKRKTFALIVERDGTLTVRAPLRASRAQIEGLVAQKEAWIRGKQEWVRQAYGSLPARRFEDGEAFLFLGQAYPLQIVDGQALALVLDGGFRLGRRWQPRGQAVFEAWYRRQAKSVIGERVAALAGRFGFEYHQVRITAARTRWGSCSAKGNLNFTWRLVMAPPPVIDYVILHELAHLRHRNHSKAFWALVGSMAPDYARHVAWLKANGQRMSLAEGAG
jgi:hypothetical protein